MKNVFLLVFLFPTLLLAQLNYLPTSTTNQVIHHKYYSLSYSKIHKQAEWVAYQLSNENVSNINVVRKDRFKVDPQIAKSESAKHSDYYKSGYHKGHLAPCRDFLYNQEAMLESFYYSNMSPQNSSFNTGIWKKLENQVREWAKENGHIYVVTGGILETASTNIGNGVSVPIFFYKIVLVHTKQSTKAIAFILPNRKSKRLLSYYVTYIDFIEEITGIDFFSSLSDEIENELESQINSDNWIFK